MNLFLGSLSALEQVTLSSLVPANTGHRLSPFSSETCLRIPLSNSLQARHVQTPGPEAEPGA